MRGKASVKLTCGELKEETRAADNLGETDLRVGFLKPRAWTRSPRQDALLGHSQSSALGAKGTAGHNGI